MQMSRLRSRVEGVGAEVEADISLICAETEETLYLGSQGGVMDRTIILIL